MNPSATDYATHGGYSSFYETQYMYQHQAPLPSPPTSPQFSWQVTTIDQDAHTHTYNDKIPTQKARRTQIPAETMANLMTGPDPADGKYVCLYGGCMRRFGRKYNIQSHIQTHLADRPFRCNVCAAGFVRRHDLVRHARIHGTGKDFVCGCGKGFSRMDALNRHRQRRICVGGADGSEIMKSRKRNAAGSSSNVGSSSVESDAGESPRESSDSRSSTPEVLNNSKAFHKPTQDTMYQFSGDLPEALHNQQVPLQPYSELQPNPSDLEYTQEEFEASRAIHDSTFQQQQQQQQQRSMNPRYAAPAPRYYYQLPDSPHKILEQGMWVNPSLISPAMTNSSQFHSDCEDPKQLFYTTEE